MTNSDDQDRKSQNGKGRSRRSLLKASGAAGVAASAFLLPNSWTKPVVRAVVVPAHAQTTVVTTTTTAAPS